MTAVRALLQVERPIRMDIELAVICIAVYVVPLSHTFLSPHTLQGVSRECCDSRLPD